MNAIPGKQGLYGIAVLCAALLALPLGGCSQPAGGNPQTAQYTVTFDSQGGSEVPAITADQGTALNRPADPVWGLYVFLGWFSEAEGGTMYTWPHSLTGNVTMYGQWDKAPRHTVTFIDHTGTSTKILYEGAILERPPNPIRDGYTFLGWFNGPRVGAMYTWPHAVMGNVAMYARWSEGSAPATPQYTVTFDSQGGSLVTAVTAYKGTALVKPADPQREGYTFLGWFNAATGGTMYSWPYDFGTGTITIYAQWREDTQPSPDRYTITFTLHDGTSVTAITADRGTILAQPANPEREGYTFRGWFDAAAGGTEYNNWPHTLAADVTMHARWEAIRYNITYDLDEGTNNPQNPATYTIEDVITFASPTRPDYTFQGWFDNSDLKGNPVIRIPVGSMGDKTFYAKWTIPAYNITYYLNGGTNNPQNPPAYTILDNITLQSPSRTGYTFEGWYDNSGFGNKVTGISLGSTGSKAFYAKWTAIPYTIAYELNGGTNHTQNPLTYTIANAVTLQPPNRAGYTFEGWYDNSGFTGSKVTVIPAGSTGDETFYANWAIITYTITYNLNGGTNHTQNPATYTIENTITLASPSRPNHTFEGWYANPGLTGDEVIGIPANSTGSRTFYAKWTPDQNQITIIVWINEDGNILVSGDNMISGGNVTISKSGAGDKPPTFTATVSGGYSGIQWYLYGDPIAGSRGTAQSIIMDAKDYAAGSYYLGVTVFKGVVPYSTNIHFTVTD
jgi:uncharacterized repeat protein (TIGR02543 family)